MQADIFRTGGQSMIFSWLRRRRKAQALIDADALAMISEFGDSAYWVARDRALEQRLYKIVDAERTPEHWNRVRFEIQKRTGSRGADTATRFLEGR
jgi:hypothetical protein